MSARGMPKPTTCQMFETPLIERFSRIHPAMPFVFWTPVLLFFVAKAHLDGMSIAVQLGLILAGVSLWSLTEYTLHRYVFHYCGPRHWQRRLYFVLHGVHHDFPDDRMRLVMPLTVSIPLGVTFYLVFRLALGAGWVDPMFVGFGVGYLLYDGIHYATHHFRMTSRLGRFLRRYHMIHHHTGEDSRYGVSSPLWDWVFGTMGSPRPTERRVRA